MKEQKQKVFLYTQGRFVGNNRIDWLQQSDKYVGMGIPTTEREIHMLKQFAKNAKSGLKETDII
jgi:hypothetical protein